MRGKAHSDETKAAVMAALLAGQGVNETARQFHIDPAIVSRWKKQAPQQELQQVAIQKGQRLEELTFDYLTALLAGLKAQVAIVSTEKYLSQQPAADVAVLHGVLADKAFRLLEAVPLNDERAEQAEGESAAGEAAQLS